MWGHPLPLLIAFAVLYQCCCNLPAGFLFPSHIMAGGFSLPLIACDALLTQCAPRRHYLSRHVPLLQFLWTMKLYSLPHAPAPLYCPPAAPPVGELWGMVFCISAFVQGACIVACLPRLWMGFVGRFSTVILHARMYVPPSAPCIKE
jgi:hypothetical protein